MGFTILDLGAPILGNLDIQISPNVSTPRNVFSIGDQDHDLVWTVVVGIWHELHLSLQLVQSSSLLARFCNPRQDRN